MKSHSLRYRMIRLSWIMVGVLLAISYLSSFWLLQREAARGIDRQLMDATQPVWDHMVRHHERSMPDLDEFGGSGRYFEVLDLSGRALDRSHDLDFDLGRDLPLPSVNFATLSAPVYASAKVSGQSLRLVLIPFARAGRDYVLAGAISTFGSAEILDLFGQIIAIIFPLSLLLAGLVSAWYVDKSLAPVRALTQHAEQMAERAIHPGGAGQDGFWRPLPVSAPEDEIGRLTATFNRLFSHADAVLRQLRQFVTDASHEIRTPLAILRGETELLLSGTVPQEEFERTLLGMDQELRRMSRIVEGLFTLSMADAGQLRLLREPLYLNEVLEDACRLVAPRAEAKSIRLERDLAGEVEFRGDEAFLHDLFMIFLDNAIKYSIPGGAVRVSLAADQQIAIAFEDEGPGIVPDEIGHIYERFYRSSAARAQGEPGSGLGLAIAQAIVTAHGGAIACNSTPGVGTIFSVVLPRTPVGRSQSALAG